MKIQATRHFFERVSERGLTRTEVNQAYTYGRRISRYGRANQYLYIGTAVTLVVEQVGPVEKFLTAYRG